MNESPAKASSAPPAPMVALTIRGSPMLGRMCRVSTRNRLTPPMRAAATKSRDGDAGDEGLAEARERGSARQSDRQHGPEPSAAEDHGEREREQQAGEGHRDAHEPGDAASEEPSEQQRCDAEDQSGADRDERGEYRERHREAGGHEDPQEQVATELVGADRMLQRGAGEHVVGVDGGGLLAPEDGSEDRRGHDEGEHHHGSDAERGAEDASHGVHQCSATVVRGSSVARTRSTMVLTMSTPVP